MSAQTETSSGSQLAASDLPLGGLVAERSVVLDQKSFEAFAVLTGDDHPLHYDNEYAKSHGLRAPIAHGLLLVAITALGATPVSAQLVDSMLAMVGTEAQFIAPVFVGDAVKLRTTVSEIVNKSKNRSVVAFNIDVVSPEELVCARVQHRFLLKTVL